MNLYWIRTQKDTNGSNYVVAADSKEKAQQIAQERLKVSCTTERVKDRHYIVGVTYLADTVS